jgi:alpha-N-arabinofuranosidase
MFHKIAAAIVVSMLLLPAYAQHVLKNPVLPGFYPDPSIVKVKEDYYLVNSTFSYFPGIPVWHSKDLQNWEQVGNVIDRPSQMDFMGEEVSRGLFAPAINYHNGTFFVTCTDIDHDGNFIVTATNPAGPWSQPVKLPQVRGIDPSLFFDTDDKAYIIYNSDPPGNQSLYSGHRTIRMYEFDYRQLQVTGQETLLVNGGVDISTKPVWIEGPHIYKRGDYYYLMAAEGGTSVNHREVVFRSTQLRGPYVPYSDNPILTQKNLDPHRNNPIAATGHADLVEGPDGKTYAVFLAVRPYEDDYYNTGRETFIAPVEWVNGWPVINPGQKEVQYAYPVAFKAVQPRQKGLPVTGNFQQQFRFENLLNNYFLFLRTHDTTWYRLNKGEVTMRLLPETCMGKGNPAFIARRQQHLTCTASTEMHFSTNLPQEKSGLTIFQNRFHFYYICKSAKEGKPVVQLFRGNADTQAMDLMAEAQLPAQQQQLFLKIEARKGAYAFSYALKKDQWQVLKNQVDGRLLSTKTAGGFVGAVFAVYATSSGQPSENTARFSWFGYAGNDSTYKE